MNSPTIETGRRLEQVVNYYSLKSIVGASKTTYVAKAPSESFYIAPKRSLPYIEPDFAKIEFEARRPTVILVSAVGATGKSALAQVLSNDTGLPLLDLGKHKPVADNTLTGLLTSTFNIQDLSSIFDGIAKGNFGVIIDGIDEGRSKTTEKAFEAFLDDIIRLSQSSTNTSFVLLGRTYILEDCWLYLTEKGIDTGLISIAPFGLEKAKKYIDSFTDALKSPYATQYQSARDSILKMLSAAFGKDKGKEDFLSFIGYPPVLDAIVTLLKEEQNFHALLEKMKCSDSSDVEIKLLHRIADYILLREREQKVLPNILIPILGDMPDDLQKPIIESVYFQEEQCARLVSHCLGQQYSSNVVSDRAINEKYEAQLVSWLPEHPFIDKNEFRNAVFESVALAILMRSKNPQCKQLVLDYTRTHKFSYYLIYMLSTIGVDNNIPVEYLYIILGSALEFKSNTASIELQITGSTSEDIFSVNRANSIIETQIEISFGEDEDDSKVFTFDSPLGDVSSVFLGSRLSSAYVSLPCNVSLSSPNEIEIIPPISISARQINLSSNAMILKSPSQNANENNVILSCNSVESTLGSISTNGITLAILVSDRTGLTYPIIRYVEEREDLPADPALREKYFRLKRILLEFKADKRGTLGKYRRKIEHERVLRNDIGRAVLRQLLADGILSLAGQIYYLHPDAIDNHLEISWLDLRKGRSSDKLLQYLRQVT